MIFVNSVIQQYEKGNAKWSGFSKEPREKYTFTNPIKILNGLYIFNHLSWFLTKYDNCVRYLRFTIFLLS